MSNLQLTKKDILLLNYIYESKLVTYENILHLFKTKNCLYKRICQLRKSNFIKDEKTINTFSKEKILSLTTSALKFLGHNNPINAEINMHILETSKVRSVLHKHFPEASWFCEDYFVNLKIHPIPDGAVLVNNNLIAIETERNAKANARYDIKFQKYNESYDFQKVLYFISNDERLESLLTRKLIWNNKIAYTTINDFPFVKCNDQNLPFLNWIKL